MTSHLDGKKARVSINLINMEMIRPATKGQQIRRPGHNCTATRETTETEMQEQKRLTSQNTSCIWTLAIRGTLGELEVHPAACCRPSPLSLPPLPHTCKVTNKLCCETAVHLAPTSNPIRLKRYLCHPTLQLPIDDEYLLSKSCAAHHAAVPTAAIPTATLCPRLLARIRCAVQ